jgi:2-polyprenyl-3-methyl-5-hydroxy-6-metoxy-1,4-benzoquinol methylase
VTRPAEPRRCWCGGSAQAPFGPRYGRCADCGTLVAREAPDLGPPQTDAESGFYGSGYWSEHQEQDLGLPGIAQRAREDLAGRCLHWLQALLAHRLPPARVLEVGCGHGGFVALLRQAGFDATGLELSPWVVEFARRTFDVPVRQGPVERQAIAAGSLDVIVMHDVVEHLPDPVATLSHVAGLLAADGLLMLQTPCAPEEASHAQLERAGDSFLKMMEEEGHLYLFSRRALERLLERAGLPARREGRAFFGYDMALMAGRQPVPEVPPAAAEAALLNTPSGRLVLALLDKARESESRRQRTLAQLLGPTVSRRLLGVLRRLRLV